MRPYSFALQCTIVQACCIIHNYIKRQGGADFVDDEELLAGIQERELRQRNAHVPEADRHAVSACFCMVLDGAAWRCRVMHGACMVQHGEVWCCLVMHGSCLMRHGAAGCCMVLHGAAWCGMVLHCEALVQYMGMQGAAWACSPPPRALPPCSPPPRALPPCSPPPTQPTPCSPPPRALSPLLATSQGASSLLATSQGASPLRATSHAASPLRATSHAASPLRATSHAASPLRATSHAASPLRATSHAASPLRATSHAASLLRATPHTASVTLEGVSNILFYTGVINKHKGANGSGKSVTADGFAAPACTGAVVARSGIEGPFLPWNATGGASGAVLAGTAVRAVVWLSRCRERLSSRAVHSCRLATAFSGIAGSSLNNIE
ncbi:unnamed protein product, partial [Closterium sp. NIES-64]